VRWLDVRRALGETPASAQRVLDAWQAQGVSARYQAIGGDAFWSSVEIIEVPELVRATTALYAAEAR
jgi:hypothetical protein